MRVEGVDRNGYLTIVSGLPRSGTSMMMQMLEAGGIPVITDNIRQADEDNPRGYYEYEPVKQLSRDTSWLATAGGKAAKLVYLLLYDLPNDHNYRVIFMERILEEVIASQEAMLDRQGRTAGSLPGTELMAIFRRHLREINDWLERQANFAVLRVSYNDVVSDPTNVIQKIDRFLDGGLDTTAMRNVLDTSLYRQRG